MRLAVERGSGATKTGKRRKTVTPVVVPHQAIAAAKAEADRQARYAAAAAAKVKADRLAAKAAKAAAAKGASKPAEPQGKKIVVPHQALAADAAQRQRELRYEAAAKAKAEAGKLAATAHGRALQIAARADAAWAAKTKHMDDLIEYEQQHPLSVAQKRAIITATKATFGANLTPEQIHEQDVRLREKDAHEADVRLQKWHMANTFTDFLGVANATASSKAQYAAYQKLFAKANPKGQQIYADLMYREQIYQQELHRRYQELSQQREDAKGGQMKWDDWYTPEEDQALRDVNKPITDDAGYQVALSTLQKWGNDAKTGVFVNRYLIDGLIAQVARYGEESTYNMVDIGNRLEQARQNGNAKAYKRIYEQEAVPAMAAYEKLYGKQDGTDEGTLGVAAAAYNGYAQSYNDWVEQRWREQHYHPDSGLTPSQVILNDIYAERDRAIAEKQWKDSGTSMSFVDWLGDQQRQQQEQTAASVRTMQAQADELTKTVGKEQGTRYKVGVDADGKLVVYPELDPDSPKREVEARLTSAAHSLGLSFDPQNGERDDLTGDQRTIEKVIDYAVDHWGTYQKIPFFGGYHYTPGGALTITVPGPFGPQTITTGLASSDEKEKRRKLLRSFFGMGDPGILEQAMKTPLGIIGAGLDYASAGLSFVGAGIADWSRRQGGQFYLSNTDTWEPGKAADYDAAKAAVKQQFQNDASLSSQWEVDRLNEIDAQFGAKSRYKWGQVNNPDELSQAEDKHQALLTSQAGNKDLLSKVQAYNNYGSNPFADPAGNFIFGLVADPSNIVPLNPFSWLARGKYALEATKGLTLAKRLPASVWHWFTVKPESLRAATQDLTRVLGQDASKVAPDALLKQLTEQLAEPHGVTRKGFDATVEGLTDHVVRFLPPGRALDRTQVRNLVVPMVVDYFKRKGLEIFNQPPPVDPAALKAAGRTRTAAEEAADAAGKVRRRDARDAAKGQAKADLVDERIKAREADEAKAASKQADAERKARGAEPLAEPPKGAPPKSAAQRIERRSAERGVPVGSTPGFVSPSPEKRPPVVSPRSPKAVDLAAEKAAAAARGAEKDAAIARGVERRAADARAVRRGAASFDGGTPTRVTMNRAVRVAEEAAASTAERTSEAIGRAAGDKVLRDMGIDPKTHKVDPKLAVPRTTLEDLAARDSVRTARAQESLAAGRVKGSGVRGEILRFEARAGRTVEKAGAEAKLETVGVGTRRTSVAADSERLSEARTHVNVNKTGNERWDAQADRLVSGTRKERAYRRGAKRIDVPTPAANSPLWRDAEYGRALKRVVDSDGRDLVAVDAVRQMHVDEMNRAARVRQDRNPATGVKTRRYRGSDVPVMAGAETSEQATVAEAARETMARQMSYFNMQQPIGVGGLEQLDTIPLRAGEVIMADGKIVNADGVVVRVLDALEMHLRKEILAAGKDQFRNVYAVFSRGIDGLPLGEFFKVRIEALIDGEYYPRGFWPVFDKIKRVMVGFDKLSEGALAFHVAGTYEFELFHGMRQAGRNADLQRISAIMRKRVEDADRIFTQDLLGEAMWLLMESRAKVDWALPHDVTVEWFRTAARDAGLDPDLAALAVASGAHSPSYPLVTRLRPLLDAVATPGRTALGREVAPRLRQYVPTQAPYATEGLAEDALPGVFEAGKGVPWYVREVQRILPRFAEGGGMGGVGSVSSTVIKMRTEEAVAHSVASSNVGHEAVEDVLRHGVLDEVADEVAAGGKPPRAGELRDRLKGAQARAKDFRVHPLFKPITMPGGATRYASLSWKTLEHFMDVYYAAGRGVRRRAVTAKVVGYVDAAGKRVRDASIKSEAQRARLTEQVFDYGTAKGEPYTFLTHGNIGLHIMAYGEQLQRINQTAWSTLSLSFAAHMIKGAGVDPEQVWDVVRYFHGDRLVDAKRGVMEAIDTHLSNVRGAYERLDGLHSDLRRMLKDAASDDLLDAKRAEIADAQKVLTDLNRQIVLKGGDDYLLLKRMGELPSLRKVSFDRTAAQRAREAARVDEARLRGFASEAESEGVIDLLTDTGQEKQRTLAYAANHDVPTYEDRGQFIQHLRAAIIDVGSSGSAASEKAVRQMMGTFRRLDPDTRFKIENEIVDSLTDAERVAWGNALLVTAEERAAAMASRGAEAAAQAKAAGKPSPAALKRAQEIMAREGRAPAGALPEPPSVVKRFGVEEEQVAGSYGGKDTVLRAFGADGEELGRLRLKRGMKGQIEDIEPVVTAWGKGVGTALYGEAERLGYGVEAISDRNAFVGNQMGHGQKFWRARKLREGRSEADIAHFLKEGKWPEGSRRVAAPSPAAVGEAPLPDFRPDADVVPEASEAAALVDALGDAISRGYTWSDFRRFDSEYWRLLAERKAKGLVRGTPEYAAMSVRIVDAKQAREHVRVLLSRGTRWRKSAAKRRAYAKGVVARTKAEVDDLVPDGAIADFAVSDGDATVEYARRLYSRYHGSVRTATKLSDDEKKLIDAVVDAFDETELDVSDLHQQMTGRRDTMLDLPSLAGDDAVIKHAVQPDAAEFVKARADHLAGKGLSDWAYTRVRAVNRWPNVKYRTTRWLLSEAQKMGGDVRANFLALRHQLAVKEGTRQVAKAARGVMFGQSDEAVVQHVFAGFHPDGTLRSVQRELDTVDAYIYERLYAKATGGLDINDVDAARPYLAGNRPPDFMTNLGALSRFMQENGFWAARHRRQFEEGRRSWAAAAQREFYRLNYADTPKWLDAKWLRDNGYFTNHGAHRKIGREVFHNELDTGAAVKRLKGESFVDWGKRLVAGDRVSQKAARSIAQQRRFWIETWGSEVATMLPNGEYGLRPGHLEWLQTAQELRVNLPAAVASSAARRTEGIASVEELVALERATERALQHLEAKGLTLVGSPVPVTMEMVTEYAQAVSVYLIDEIGFLPKSEISPWYMRFLHGQADFRRALTMWTPSFAGINVLDTESKGLIRSVSPISMMKHVVDPVPYKRARDLIGEVLDFDTSGESGLGRAFGHAKVDGESWIRIVGDFFPGALTGIEERSRVRVARHVFAEVWRDKLKMADQHFLEYYGRAATTPAERELVEGIADGLSLIAARDEVRRFFPSLTTAGYAERLLNEVSPFLSYGVRNKVAWMGFIFDNPVWLSRINQLGMRLEQYNRAEWARTHPDGEPFPENKARLLRLPWSDAETGDVFLDLSELTDATRGLSLLGGNTKSVRDWFWNVFRLASPTDVAAIHAVTDALGVTGSWKWLPDYDPVTGQRTGEHRVWVGDGEPWSGDPVSIASLFWPAALVGSFVTLAENGLSAVDLTRLLHQTFFYGDLKILEPGELMSQTFWMLKDKDEAAAQRYFDEHAADIRAYWDKQHLVPRDWIIPQSLVDFERLTRPDPKTWLKSQPYDVRVEVGQGYEDLQGIYGRYDLRIDDAVLAGNFDLARDLRTQRREEILSYYRSHPLLTTYEYMRDGPEGWATQQADWLVDDRVDQYFALLETRPERRDGESQAAWDARFREWDMSLRLFQNAYPQVVDRVRGGVDSIAAAKAWQDLIWERARQRQYDLTYDLEAAKRDKDYDASDLIYLQKDFDAAIFETDVYALYDVPDSQTGKFGLVNLGDLTKVITGRMTPAERDKYDADKLYAQRMKAVIDFAKGGKNGKFNPKRFAEEMKRHPDLLQQWFDNNPGKQAEWQATEDYLRLISRFGKLASAGHWDAAYKYYDNLPAWVRQRYEKGHPNAGEGGSTPYTRWWGRFHKLMDSGHRKEAFAMYNNMPAAFRKRYYDKHPEKRAEALANKRYADWWSRYFRLHDSGRHDAAFAMYNNMPDWVRQRYFANHPEKRNQQHESGRYIGYMQHWVGLFKAGHDDAANAYFDGLPQWAKDRYFANHPGKRDSWGQRSEYSKYMGGWIRLIDKGGWDAANKYFWGMPDWVRERYFKGNPDSGMRKTRPGAGGGGGWSTGKYREYTDALGGWVDLIKTGNWDRANAYFWNMPSWVRSTYFKNNPDSGMKKTKPGSGPPQFQPSGQDRAYVDAMGKWVALYKAGDTQGAEDFFRNLPEWMQQRYLQKHPDKAMMGEDRDMVGLLTQYFQADDATQAQLVADNPQIAQWVSQHSADSQRLGILTYIYQHLPKDAWIQRVFREKYPEVFSEEAVGARRAQAKWDEAISLGLTDEMAAMIERLTQAALDAGKMAVKPPKPYTFEHAKRRRKHSNTYSSADLARAA